MQLTLAPTFVLLGICLEDWPFFPQKILCTLLLFLVHKLSSQHWLSPNSPTCAQWCMAVNAVLCGERLIYAPLGYPPHM